MTKNFTIEELTRSSFAARNNISNIPNKEQKRNLRYLASRLEFIRLLLGNCPIVVNSAFRNTEVNAGVFGSSTSSHIDGLAADIVPGNSKSIRENALTIKESSLEFDQIIIYKSFIHIGFGKKMRRQVIYRDN